MASMDSTLGWVVVAALVVVIILALTIGRRLISGSIGIGGLSAKVEGRQEARVSDSTAYGKDISVTATGAGSVVENTRSTGTGIKIGASTTPEAPVEKKSPSP
jgi:hypothetical protein